VVAPDGNGGLIEALHTSGALRDMEIKGIKYSQIYGVDNVLTVVADPMCIGCLALSGHSFLNKVVRKTSPEEKVGVVCLNNGKPAVVEYSELTGNLKTDPNYSLANIAQHFATTAFLQQVDFRSLPLHRATKKIPHRGDPNPVKPNGLKYEKFIFDCLPTDTQTVIVPRDQHFAPLKNKTGKDSAETARRAYLRASERDVECVAHPAVRAESFHNA
jgi:UDP-N-acetylglucosamine pyrophosphorylase